MPIPTTHKDENHDDFMSRCMANPTMNDEYPDNKQRYAVCQSQWDASKEKKMNESRVKINNSADRVGNQPEIRSYAVDDFRVESRKDSANNESKHIVGHAAIFNVLSEEMGFFFPFREKIASGAFDYVLGDDVRALFNHDPNHVLGRSTNKSLLLSIDDRGLQVDITPPDTAFAVDLLKSIERGDINQMSVAFRVAEDGNTWFEDTDGKLTRTITKFEKLYDVSPVTYPAYPQTDVSVRDGNPLDEIGRRGFEIIAAKRGVPISILRAQLELDNDD